METYKNILIRETRTNVIEGIKEAIDILQYDNYSVYEVIIEMCEIDGVYHYKTCLAEDNDSWLSVYGELTAEQFNSCHENARMCSECGQVMQTGYYAQGEYYCSDDCLQKHFTVADWAELCEDGDSDEYYYTEWN